MINPVQLEIMTDKQLNDAYHKAEAAEKKYTVRRELAHAGILGSAFVAASGYASLYYFNRPDILLATSLIGGACIFLSYKVLKIFDRYVNRASKTLQDIRKIVENRAVSRAPKKDDGLIDIMTMGRDAESESAVPA